MGPHLLARIAAGRHAPALGAGLLGLAAAGQAIAIAAASHAVDGSVIPYAALLCLIALAGTLPLGVLRPVPAAVMITVATVVLRVLGALSVAGMAAQLIAGYRLGAAGTAGAAGTRGRNTGAQLLAIGLPLPFLVLALITKSIPDVLLATLVPVATGTGIAVGARREARIRTASLEEIADTLSEHTARGERARIARELHDVVAHHISMIAVQAETARLTTPGLPDAGARRFAEIGQTARAGLTEMRRLLGVLREDADATVADRHPQPGLPQLTELIDLARDASPGGARLIVSGPVAGLDPGVEIAAYRIVQEALTNARRHAPGAAVDVELRYGDDALRLRVRDNGPGPGPSPGNTGHGLLGMRERAAAVGGSVRTGDAAGGGFCVEALLPVKPELLVKPELPVEPEVS
jgi:signal transduction histidine kinase